VAKKNIRYYKSYSDDFYQTDKEYKLDENYRYIDERLFYRIGSAAIYILAFLISEIYCRVFLHVKFVGSNKLKKEKRGFFVYGNHTQPMGDVFNPALACFPKRIYTVVSVANMHLPVIGKLVKPLGAIPVPSKISQLKHFKDAVTYRYKEGRPIVIYPEGHLWDYYTGIRDFNATSFRYPAELFSNIYTLTSTYQKRKFGKKPRITIYVDGPFSSNAPTLRERANELQIKCADKMKERAKYSNYEYVEYKKYSDLTD